METIELLYLIIEKHSGVACVEIYPEMRLTGDLKLGPLSKMELLFDLEESFCVHIPADKVIDIKRVADLLRLLNNE